ncbi:hypothetical protein Tco_0853502 [Tanacetum coccineum]
MDDLRSVAGRLDEVGYEYGLSSLNGWTKEGSLIGQELVQETTDKVVLIKEKLKAARGHQKSYADNRRKPLEFEVGDRVMVGARVDVRTYLLGGAIDGSKANGIIRDPKLELESSRFTFDLVPLSYESVDVVVGENWLLRHKVEMERIKRTKRSKNSQKPTRNERDKNKSEETARNQKPDQPDTARKEVKA